jgi:hypothetical protein
VHTWTHTNHVTNKVTNQVTWTHTDQVTNQVKAKIPGSDALHGNVVNVFLGAAAYAANAPDAPAPCQHQFKSVPYSPSIDIHSSEYVFSICAVSAVRERDWEGW